MIRYKKSELLIECQFFLFAKFNTSQRLAVL
jgi:hypothetical protein